MKSFFVELLSLGNIFSIIKYLLRDRLDKKNSEIQIYIYDSSSFSFAILKILSLIFKFRLEKMDFALINVRDEFNTSVRLKILYKELSKIKKYIESDIRYKKYTDQLIGSDEHCSREKYLIKSILIRDYNMEGSAKYYQIMHALLIIQVSIWMMRIKKLDPEIYIFLNRREWFDNIKKYAKQDKVHLIPINHRSININDGLYKLIRLFPRLKSIINYSFFKNIILSQYQKITKKSHSDKPSDVKIAVEYNSQLNLQNDDLISDLFFYKKSNLTGADIAMLFGSSSDPIDNSKWIELKKHNISAIALSEQASMIDCREIPIVSRNFFKQDRHIYVNDIRKDGSEASQIYGLLHSYERHFSYWRELFLQNNIVLYTSWYKFGSDHMVISDAIKSIGGISSLYQRSYESAPSPITTVAADVYFGFSKASANIEKQSDSLIPYYVITGFLNDYLFSNVKKLAYQIRDELLRKGASKIIAYLDSSSGDDSRWFIGHDTMQKNYAYLLESVLKNQWMGLVIKPKMPFALHEHLGPVATTLDRAIKTGRCYIFDQRNWEVMTRHAHGSYPPAVAALAADITVSDDLSSGTAALESALAGAKTLLLDFEGWHESPLYKLGVGRVIFHEWDDLWKACVEYLHSNGKNSGLGDWEPMINELDPFRDGKAAERIGTYFKWILDGFKAGTRRDAILADAAEHYCRIWGSDKIIEIK